MIKSYTNGSEHRLAEEFDGIINRDYTITVGENGCCQTLNEALEIMSRLYPTYKRGGWKCEIKILSGTTIHEQIAVIGIDLSHVTIVAEDAEVPVNVDGFTSQGLNAHDLRTPNVGAFIGGENGALLPKVGCVFKVTQNTNNIPVVGYFANRSSVGVVLANCGFDGFNDGVISNNESSITIREGIARNNARYGVHARHNGEVSARSCDCSGNGTYGAYADRVANLDVREAIIDNCDIAINGEHASNICAAGTHSTGCRLVARAQTCAIVDCSGMEVVNPTGTIFNVGYGGMLNCNTVSLTNGNNVDVTNIAKNTLTASGIIWG